MTDVSLRSEQTKLLALNSKFVSRPALPPMRVFRDAFDDFVRRLRLREEAASAKSKQPNLYRAFGLPEKEKGQLTYVP
ncbi:hypothetical protein EIP91_011476 [Steccherinum ochraceum]|uniref:Uncharacterized protein n=1 Tax=Steccherinum ochraceum TaxID=92696 RepID=A0A4R0R7Z1_9APHY|nr:hypothetical protein EIP91_011476 [Steccherinum ochraceum]